MLERGEQMKKERKGKKMMGSQRRRMRGEAQNHQDPPQRKKSVTGQALWPYMSGLPDLQITLCAVGVGNCKKTTW